MSFAHGDAIARNANADNNAMYQVLRFARWTVVRDALWNIVDPLLPSGGRVALIGGGSCDDVPLARIADRAGQVDLIDFDTSSTGHAIARLSADQRTRAAAVEHDVTGGSADIVLRAVRDDVRLPDTLAIPSNALGTGEYDLVVGDLLYTQLLHAGLLALGVHGARQHELMRRYDPQLTDALVQRIQASLRPGGHAIHVHDVACWSMPRHDQPISLEAALRDPAAAWPRLRRHDACDPHLRLAQLGYDVLQAAWWPWAFSTDKQFLVRASVSRATVDVAGVA